MLRLQSPRRVWRSWTLATVEGELAQRREAVLLEMLATLVVLGLVAQTFQLANHLFGDGSSTWWLWIPALSVTTASFYGLLQLARRGRHRTSAVALLAVLLTVTLGLLASDGLARPMWALLSATCVLLAAMLLGQRQATAVAAFTCAAAICTGLAQAASPASFATAPTGDPFAAPGPVLLIVLIARSCWLYTRETAAGIDDVLSHGSEASPLRQMRTKGLSVREIEVVQLVAEGLTNDAIGKRLFLSPRTVQSHVANAMGKTMTANRTELGVLAVREGLVPIALEIRPKGTPASRAQRSATRPNP